MQIKGLESEISISTEYQEQDTVADKPINSPADFTVTLRMTCKFLLLCETNSTPYTRAHSNIF